MARHSAAATTFVVLLFSASVLIGQETPPAEPVAPASPPARVRPSEAELQAYVADHLLRKQPESLLPTVERIWLENGGLVGNRTTSAGAELAQRIAAGIHVDFNTNMLSWEIHGFTNDSNADRAALFDVIDAAYLSWTVDDATRDALERGFEIVTLPAGLYDPFAVPAGLTMPAEELLALLGYNVCRRLDGVPFPYSPEMCFLLARGCYLRGLYADARALADHGLKQRDWDWLRYIRGASELALGDSAGAVATIRESLAKTGVMEASALTSAGINGPIGARFYRAFLAVAESPDAPPPIVVPVVRPAVIVEPAPPAVIVEPAP